MKLQVDCGRAAYCSSGEQSSMLRVPASLAYDEFKYTNMMVNVNTHMVMNIVIRAFEQ